MQTTTTISKERAKEIASEIASEIVAQLGGAKFYAMTGSKAKYYDGATGAMTFQLTRNAAKAQYLTIELNVMDTYKMTFFSMSKSFERSVKAEFDGIYCDMLQEIFTKTTGLLTSLGTMGK